MAYDIGPKIGIEGEAQFRKAIQNINTNLKTLGTEMQAVSSEFDKNDKSQENLTAQNKVLTKQIEEQKNKLEQLKSGLQQASEKYGENDKVTQGWQQSVNKATAELNKFKRKLDENNESLKSGEKATGDFESGMNSGSDTADIFAGVLSGNLVAKGVEVVVGAFIDATKEMATFFAETEAELGKFQAQLGAIDSEAKKFNSIALEVFSDGFGESIGSAADSIAKVKQMFGELSDKELKSITESAYVLEDAFEIDINEGLRGASSLMKQFRIDSEEAFDLIIKGAQNGLNQNQDLADQVAEYSVYFSDLGYSASEFFDMMNSGAKDGVFQIDYLNDVVKEFGIRTKDSSDTTARAFQELGLNADEYFKLFAAGGEDAQKATEEVTKRLFAMTDKVAQETIGVALFGTKWEDLGIDAVKAVMTMQTGIGETVGATEQASQAMYDNFSAQIMQIQRKTQTAIYELANGMITADEFSAKIQEVMTLGAKTILNNIPVFIDTGLDIITGLANGIADNSDELVPKVYEIVVKIQQSLIEHIPEIGIAGAKIMAGLAIGMVKAIPEILTVPPKIISSTAKALEKGKEEMKEAGKQMIVGFANGIKESATWLYNQVKDVFANVIKESKDTLGIHSPSKVFAGIGGYMAEGLGTGFMEKMKKVSSDIQKSVPTSADISTKSTQNTGTNIVQYNNFYSPKALNAGEAARQQRKVTRDLALGIR